MFNIVRMEVIQEETVNIQVYGEKDMKSGPYDETLVGMLITLNPYFLTFTAKSIDVDKEDYLHINAIYVARTQLESCEDARTGKEIWRIKFQFQDECHCDSAYLYFDEEDIARKTYKEINEQMEAFKVKYDEEKGGSDAVGI